MRDGQTRMCGWAVCKIVCPHCGLDAINVYPDDAERIECTCGQWFETPLAKRMKRRIPVSLERRTAERVN